MGILKKVLGRKRGFTLVELLVAIAVIGILVAMLIPAVSKVLESARRAKDANCLKQIAIAYYQYCMEDINGRNISSDCISALDWALILAKYLNDPSMYCFSGDSRASKVVKKAIITESGSDNEAWDLDKGLEFSVYLISGIPVGAPLTSTPIAFTRGIPSTKYDSSTKSDSEKIAKWPSTGVYGSTGGYIAFLDGHVEWFENLGTSAEGKLLTWNSNALTNNIFKAIPKDALILETGGPIIEE
jgi:prepilin-type N-terminal cleavage/methylation domain-containing protein/prepilin-type processing-associated H-X9-DG protein